MTEITFAGKRFQHDTIYVTGTITNGPTISFAITDEDLYEFLAHLRNPYTDLHYFVENVERSYNFFIKSHNGFSIIKINAFADDHPRSNFVYEKQITNAAMLEALNDMIVE